MNTATQKIALVTGATRGIGLETVRQLAQAGVHTLLAGRKRDVAVAEALKLQAEGLPVEAIFLACTHTHTGPIVGSAPYGRQFETFETASVYEKS
ncbi:MAG: SDR family NAD(P)-dependent oxidoreductase, partial [Stenotrophomonas maltophilia]